LFSDKNDLVILEIETDKITSKVIFETGEGISVVYPHIYGPINLDSVMRWYSVNA